MKSFIDWLNDLGIYDTEDLGLFVLKGFFVLGIITWIMMLIGFLCVDNGISAWWSPIAVFVFLVGSFLAGIFMSYLNTTK